MSPPRFVQNFSQCRALIVSRDRRAIDVLDATLPKLGLVVAHVPLVEDEATLPVDAIDAERDILVVDGDLHRPLNWPIAVGCDLPPLPVIGLVGVEAPSRLKALMQIGATAFVSKPVHGATLFSALVLCVNEYGRKRQLLADLAAHETRRRQRRFVIKAVVASVQSDRIDDDMAYDRLRRGAMRARMSVEAFSEMLVRARASGEDPDAAEIPRQIAGE